MVVRMDEKRVEENARAAFLVACWRPCATSLGRPWVTSEMRERENRVVSVDFGVVLSACDG